MNTNPLEEIKRLKEAYDTVLEENQAIKSSVSYRIAQKEKQLAERLHITGLINLLLSIQIYGWHEAFRQNKIKKITHLSYSASTSLETQDTNSFVSYLNIPDSFQELYDLADIDNSGSVAIYSITFFRYDGSSYYAGGAERYLLDLYEVCRELNLPCRIYQFAEYNWVRFYKGLEVIGLKAQNNNVNFYNNALLKEMNSLFFHASSNAALRIYSPFYILRQNENKPSIGISHGVSWDGFDVHYRDGNSFWENNKDIIEAAARCGKMISVDTNTCNWFQTIDYNTGQKIHYIPNYVNSAEFYPPADNGQSGNAIKILYPRRLYAARGLYLVLEIIDDILSAYPEVEFHFVGKGWDKDTASLKKKAGKWKERVRMYSLLPEDMPDVYRNADITLIPTCFSEGTSLSCLEALASGNAVIATRIGGLTDLIINNYNGLLIEPNSVSLKKAICDLLNHPEKRHMLMRNAVFTAKAFPKKEWKYKWRDLIIKTIKDIPDMPINLPKRCILRIKLKKHINDSDVVSIIKAHLLQGHYVYVACPENPYRLQSYKRLQFIDLNEDIYFKPEIEIDL